MFITFEGVEGSGKSSVISFVDKALSKHQVEVVRTREPGGTNFGVKLRDILLNVESRGLCSEAELLLFCADRAEHVKQLINPALAQGKTVLCDRFTDSTIAYQGYGRGVEIDKLVQLCEFATSGLTPDLVILLDCDPEIALGRAKSRDSRDGQLGSDTRFEQEKIEFHQRVRDGFLKLAAASPQRFSVFDSNLSLEEVSAKVLAEVEQRLALGA